MTDFTDQDTTGDDTEDYVRQDVQLQTLPSLSIHKSLAYPVFIKETFLVFILPYLNHFSALLTQSKFIIVF